MSVAVLNPLISHNLWKFSQQCSSKTTSNLKHDIWTVKEKRERWPNKMLPEVIRIATIVQNVVTEITNMATDSAPMYIAVAKAKKRAKNPPAAAKDISSDMTMAFMVAARKKSINTSSPVTATKVTVPTCSNEEKQITCNKINIWIYHSPFSWYEYCTDQGRVCCLKNLFSWHIRRWIIIIIRFKYIFDPWKYDVLWN